MPLDWDLNGCDNDGYSVMTDLGQFGAVMFEMVTGQRCRFDLLHDWKGTVEVTSTSEWKGVEELPSTSEWKTVEELPSRNEVWLGHIMEKCWNQGFQSAKALATELEELSITGDRVLNP
ncbi:hypothetical protein A1O3_09253 [Capronia epimyces CBS 606.96]|uniref:Serine-threonine/tyrosine-protein kinase catalytic domain-containing protein n=1 Tax=Capronia epimyces CBS 606.96 TaxID=1182542 RepID=W9XC78_9EURO|nr:uncharacterized protein A1O3_09253 [Capronia epimyces CBS 606.96]EXJ78092.1 hypothetical protein A1O3_09253 [Capronia epimyces CBS 606.96]